MIRPGLLRKTKYITLISLIILIILFLVYHETTFNVGQTPPTGSSSEKTYVFFKKLLIKNNIIPQKDIFIPKKSEYTNKVLKKLMLQNPETKIFFMYNCGSLANRKSLWEMLKQHYDLTVAQTIMPKTYILPDDIHDFNANYNTKKTYILKKNIQKQKGLKLTNNYNEIINHNKSNYILVQEIIPHVKTYKGYKFNIRIYFLFSCHNRDKFNIFIYPDGIISYAPKKYDKTNLTFDNCISTFYKSTKLYDQGFPILLSQLSVNYLKKIKQNISVVLNAAKKYMGNEKLNSTIETYQLFGADFLIDENEQPWLLEINAGPGMNPYNKCDHKMRMQMLQDIIDRIFHDKWLHLNKSYK